MNHLHLTVLALEGNRNYVANVKHYSLHDLRWNDDFTAFWVIPLRWWDDASYVAHQAEDAADYEEYEQIYAEANDSKLTMEAAEREEIMHEADDVCPF